MRYLFLILFLFLSVPVMAQEEPNAKIDIFASRSMAMPGDEIEIAIRQTIRDEWHTYWLNAGDSGEAIKVEWFVPQNIQASAIQFPIPKRIAYDPLVNFGYEGAPVYLQTLKIPDNYQGDVITFSGQASWLVCQEICIPESQNISFSIPIGKGGEAINNALFFDAKNAIPQIVDWNATASTDGDKFILSVVVPEMLHNQMTDVEIYPFDWGLIKPSSDIVSNINDNTIDFIGDYAGRGLEKVTIPYFLIKTDRATYQVTTETKVSEGIGRSLVIAILFAFLGGLILNLMPCVFPILSMKALSLVKLSDKDKSHVRGNGIAYTSGVVLSFVGIAGLLIILQSFGATIGWGFQLQNPIMITVLAAILFLVGLNLSGFFEISGRFASVGSSLTTGNNHKSSFFTGVLATLVATPCTAPFMAPAIGYALTQPPAVSLIIFAVLGFGLAFPYLLLTFVPAIQKIFPRPGLWMETFKQALAFPMFASSIWLIWVLAQQVGTIAIPYILGLLLGLSFLIWLFKKTHSFTLKLGFVILFLVFAGFFFSTLKSPQQSEEVIFTQDYLNTTLSENPNNPVFVNMTAAWCITCLVNERTSLSTSEVENAFEDNNVIYIKGDWTNRNPEITKFLESYGRNGVPLYVYYGKVNAEGVRPESIILPQILTPTMILEILEGDYND